MGDQLIETSRKDPSTGGRKGYWGRFYCPFYIKIVWFYPSEVKRFFKMKMLLLLVLTVKVTYVHCEKPEIKWQSLRGAPSAKAPVCSGVGLTRSCRPETPRHLLTLVASGALLGLSLLGPTELSPTEKEFLKGCHLQGTARGTQA